MWFRTTSAVGADDGQRSKPVAELRQGRREKASPFSLFPSSFSQARDAGYQKFLVQVRSSNTAAQAFYGRLGFQDCGRLSRQIIIDGVADDEVVMELLHVP